MRTIYVTGSIESASGGGDGAYSLIGKQTIEEFISRIRETLENGVRPLLVSGRNNECGHVLNIQIYDEDPDAIA